MQNILLQGSHVLLTDFGFSICLKNHRPLTRLGTLHFMAPEVLLNDPRDSASRFREQVDRSSRKSYGRGVDIWAIGVIIYECLLHRAPFNGPDEKSVVQAIIANEPSYENYLRYRRAALGHQIIDFGAWLPYSDARNVSDLLGPPRRMRSGSLDAQRPGGSIRMVSTCPALPVCSPQAVDFLRRCLTTISNQRPTAHDLYSHQWVSESRLCCCCGQLATGAIATPRPC